jgi:hypothetical protein
MCNQSLQRVLKRANKNSVLKNVIWVSKNAEFQTDFKSVENVLKVISKNVTEICPFFTFTHVRQTCFAYNLFLVHFFTTFSTASKSAWNSAFFDILFYLFHKIFFGHISTFWKQKTAQKIKNIFCKCVLDFNLHPSKGLYSSFSKKSQIRCTLLYSAEYV